MQLITRLRRHITARRAALERRHTEFVVNSLPFEVQKDIGWPGFYPETRTETGTKVKHIA